MSDDPRLQAARTWLIERHGGDESAEQLAPELLAVIDAVDPLRRPRGDAVEALLCEWHNGTRWKDGMSTHYVNGQREVATRALNAALAVMGQSRIEWHSCRSMKPSTTRDVLLDWPGYSPNPCVGRWIASEGFWTRGSGYRANPRRWAEIPIPPPWTNDAEAGTKERREEAPAQPFPAWGPEVADLVRKVADAAWFHDRNNGAGEGIKAAIKAAFPDPAREG